ncbi:MAG TPA: hypothetical protein VHW09_25880 [Bryobacteraceae bacterium]|jgi:hypothetical protein|nr:hypothetical protein [Bryobacteraceae bacterium]
MRRAIGLAILAFLPAAQSSGQSVPGTFLYRDIGAGSIVAVDGAGQTYYQIVPQGGAGFDTTENFSGNILNEFSMSHTGTRIAFSSSHWGFIENDLQVTALPSARIFIMNADGTGVRQLTFHNPAAAQSESDYSPQLSPDATRIAYVGGETIAPPGTISSNGVDCSGQETQALWIMNADGTGNHLIRSVSWGTVSYCNAGAVQEMAWNLDGTKLLVRDTFGGCYGGREVGIVNADGSNYQQLTCIAANGGPYLGLDWSPDGKKVVALVGGSSSSGYEVWDVSTGTPTPIGSFPNSLPNGSQNGNDKVRFSPDSSMLAIADGNNGGSIFVVDFNGNSLATINTQGHENLQGGYDAFWWSAASTGTLGSMTLGEPSVYLNACTAYTVNLLPSTYNASGVLLTHGFSGANINIASGDGDSYYLDPFGFMEYSPTRASATGTVQLSNFAVSSNTVPLTVESTCTCQAAAVAGLRVVRGGLRYVTSSQAQMAQTLTVTNTTGASIVGPIDIVVSQLSPAVTLVNASGTSGCASSGSPFITALPAGTLAAGASVTVQLLFRDPLLTGFTYTTAVTTGYGAP